VISQVIILNVQRQITVNFVVTLRWDTLRINPIGFLFKVYWTHEKYYESYTLMGYNAGYISSVLPSLYNYGTKFKKRPCFKKWLSKRWWNMLEV